MTNKKITTIILLSWALMFLSGCAAGFMAGIDDKNPVTGFVNYVKNQSRDRKVEDQEEINKKVRSEFPDMARDCSRGTVKEVEKTVTGGWGGSANFKLQCSVETALNYKVVSIKTYKNDNFDGTWSYRVFDDGHVQEIK